MTEQNTKERGFPSDEIHFRHAASGIAFREAVRCLQSGMVICYPTETFFAVGCSAFNRLAVHDIYKVKRRPDAKPLPVIIGSREQLALVTETQSPLVSRLADAFWPGSLTILVPARTEVPTVLTGESGRVAVRLSPHPVAQELCRAIGGPLVSTSANISGRSAVADAALLDPELVAETAGVLNMPPAPAGGQASTLVEIAGPESVRIVRVGAVSEQELVAAGVSVLA